MLFNENRFGHQQIRCDFKGIFEWKLPICKQKNSNQRNNHKNLQKQSVN